MRENKVSMDNNIAAMFRVTCLSPCTKSKTIQKQLAHFEGDLSGRMGIFEQQRHQSARKHMQINIDICIFYDMYES